MHLPFLSFRCFFFFFFLSLPLSFPTSAPSHFLTSQHLDNNLEGFQLINVTYLRTLWPVSIWQEQVFLFPLRTCISILCLLCSFYLFYIRFNHLFYFCTSSYFKLSILCHFCRSRFSNYLRLGQLVSFFCDKFVALLPFDFVYLFLDLPRRRRTSERIIYPWGFIVLKLNVSFVLLIFFFLLLILFSFISFSVFLFHLHTTWWLTISFSSSFFSSLFFLSFISFCSFIFTKSYW